jgi:hypothetical protein
MKRVYSCTIQGKNDCVEMTKEEASIIALKFGSRIEMYDMTERHGIRPVYLKKALRHEQHEWEKRNASFSKGIKVGSFGGAAPVDWQFDDLMNVKIGDLNG